MDEGVGRLSSSGASILEYVALFAVVVVVMIVTSILPQRRRDRETRQMLERVRRGVRVVTRGGIYGLVTDVQDDVVTLRIADKVEIKLAKSAIGEVVRPADAAEDEPPQGGGGGRKGRR